MMNKNIFIICNKGNIPLILSVPHGGTNKFEDILHERESGIKGIDKNTIQIALKLKESIKYYSQEKFKTQITPSLVFSNVHRSRIDFNRPPSEAYPADSKLSEKVYNDFHENLKKLLLYNFQNWKVSYLIDIHGFEKSKRPPGFMNVEIVIGTKNLQTLFHKGQPKNEKHKNIRNLIIEELHNNNIFAAPVWPRQKEYVLTGGYITQKYGAENYNFSKSMQIEFSDDIRYNDEKLYLKVIRILSKTLSNFFLSK